MKRINEYLLKVGVVTMMVLAVSCTKDFDKINKNNNELSADEEHPDLLLTHAIESMTDQIHDVWLGHEIGSCWVQHMAKVQYTDEDRYVPRNDVINAIWTSFYAGSGIEAQRIYEIGKSNGLDNYMGVALVLKCYIFSVLTDLYGDIPYSEAFKVDSVITPKYDTQESIYIDLIAKLDLANSLLNPDELSIEGDILYNNDILRWKKFANSLRLRLLLRISDRSDYQSYVTDEMTNMLVTNAINYPIFESNSDNAALQYLGSSPNNNPLNETYKTRDDHRVSKTLIDMMYDSNNHDHPDWRIVVYARTPDAGGFWVGLPNGLTSAAAAAYLGNGIRCTSKIGTYFIEPDAPGMLMSYAELKFILAEAVQRGLISGSSITAQQYYEDGIYASYTQFGNDIVTNVPVYYPGFAALSMKVDDYYSDYLSHNGAWDAANALEKIATQKWIAMFDQGIQAWFEWRRTGYPLLTPALDGLNDGKIPVRLKYPSDEYARNEVNLNDAVARQGTDNLNTRVWWDIANNF